MTFDVLVVGGANMDYLVKGPSLPKPGCAIQGKEFQEAPGGKGINQAVAAARLGARVGLIGRIGEDERGRTILQRLCDEHIDSRAIVQDKNAPTGVALVMIDDAGRKQILTAPGANLLVTGADIAAAGDLIASARVLLLPVEMPLGAVSAAVRLARSAGVTVVLDPPPLALPESLLRDVDVLRSNAVEAQALTDISVHDQATAREAAAKLLRCGVSAACISAPGGDLLVFSNGELWLPHLAVKMLDATGAGDAFVAALAVGLARRQSLQDIARFASAAAALATTRLGALESLPHRDAVLAFMASL